MSKIKSASEIGFNQAFALVESLGVIMPKLEASLTEVRYRDFEMMLRDPTLTPFQIYMRGFTAMDRLTEELRQNVNHDKNAKD